MVRKLNIFIVLVLFLISCTSKNLIKKNTPERSFNYRKNRVSITDREKDIIEKEFKKPLDEVVKEHKNRIKPVESADSEITISDCIKLAFERNYSYQRQVESVYKQSLSLLQEKQNWTTDFTFAVNPSFNFYPDNQSDMKTSAILSLNKKFIDGSKVDLSTSASIVRKLEGIISNSNSSYISMGYTKSLLKGAGKIVVMESLTNAERALVYAVRNLELAKQSLILNVIKQAYSIEKNKQRIGIAESEVERYKYLYNRTKSMFEANRVSAIDVQRAQQELLQSRNRLINQKESFDLLNDSFKQFLNLSIDKDFVITDNIIVDTDIENDSSDFFDMALTNRLDWRNELDKYDDKKRNIIIKNNQLKPRVDLKASASVSSDDDKSFAVEGNDVTYNVGINMDFPYRRTPEKVNSINAEIALIEQERSINTMKTSIRINLKSILRRIRNIHESIKIQKMNIELAQKRVENAYILLQEGKKSNREVIEAQEDLSRAEDSLMNLMFDLKIAVLELQKEQGILYLKNIIKKR